MNKYLIEILNERGRITLPGFGILKKNAEGIVVFEPDPNAKDDGFAEYLSKKENVDQATAKQRILTYVREISNLIRQGDKYYIFGLGYFEKKGDQEVAFFSQKFGGSKTPGSSGAEKKEDKPKPVDVREEKEAVKKEWEETRKSAGDGKDIEKPSPEQPAKDRSSEKPEKPEGKPDKPNPSERRQLRRQPDKKKSRNSKKGKKWPVVLVIILLLLGTAGAAGYYFRDVFKKQYRAFFENGEEDDRTARSAEEGSDEPEKPTEASAAADSAAASLTDSLENMSPETEKTETPEPKDVKKTTSKAAGKTKSNRSQPKSVASGSTGPYHIIGNVFEFENNADRYLSDMKKKGYQPKKMEVNGYYFVAVQSFDSRQSARDNLNEVAAEIPGAWIFRHAE